MWGGQCLCQPNSLTLNNHDNHDDKHNDDNDDEDDHIDDDHHNADDNHNDDNDDDQEDDVRHLSHIDHLKVKLDHKHTENETQWMWS